MAGGRWGVVVGSRAWRVRLVSAGALSLALVMSGCSGSTDTTGSSGQAKSFDAAASQANAPTAAGANSATADQSGAAVQGSSFKIDAVDAPASETGRSFVSTATMTVDVDDVNAAKPKVIAAVESAGGALFAEQTSYGAQARSVLTVKVPPAVFTRTLDEIAKVGTMAAQEIKTDDVTQQVVDLDARITAADASLEATRALLAGAKSLTDISQLENEVQRRQADSESLKGQRKTLQGKVDLATIVVTLSGEKDATPAVLAAKTAPPSAELPGFLDGFSGGVRVAATAGTITLAVLGALVPFVPLLVLAGLGIRWRRRRRSPLGSDPAPAT